MCSRRFTALLKLGSRRNFSSINRSRILDKLQRGAGRSQVVAQPPTSRCMMRYGFKALLVLGSLLGAASIGRAQQYYTYHGYPPPATYYPSGSYGSNPYAAGYQNSYNAQ